jgi:UrcA family protein
MSAIFKFALASFGATVVLAPVAMAQIPAEPASVRVAYGDLNMSTQAGGEILLKRISTAARRACQKVTTASPLTPHAIASCKHETIGSTVRQLDIATLTAVWEGAPAETTVALSD